MYISNPQVFYLLVVYKCIETRVLVYHYIHVHVAYSYMYMYMYM